MMRKAAIAGVALVSAGGGHAGPAAPAPTLEYAFTASVLVAPPVEMGQADGGRKRFIAITGGTVSGPMLAGEVLPGGGDWHGDRDRDSGCARC